MDFIYNVDEHVRLLNRFQYWKDLGKSIFQEEPKDGAEFFVYNLHVEDFVWWNKRFEIVSVIENFLNGNIGKKQFSSHIFAFRIIVLEEFVEICNTLVSDPSSEKSQNFNPDLKIEGAMSLGVGLFELCYSYQDYDAPDLINEQFSEKVEQFLFQFQDLLEEDENS